jgi:hypothetical protein
LVILTIIDIIKRMVATTPVEQILQRIIETGGAQLPPEVARFFLNLSLNQADQNRISALSEKSNDGELDAQERDELAAYVLVGDFLTLMQSRARTVVKNPSSAA